ncbi:unnamed protein product [Mytilus edulis]|uniref:Uncharacterized protein n=1 Tax=Mytilus edulis TaxID=6550 RepID=A0A8S3UGC5_MYTED|nr:unnamed protein product [Mytilus edulis]
MPLKDGSIRDGYGKEIQIEENEKWNKVDADYTPYNNILSSTWHSLRHKDFIWAVIQVKALDTVIYYKDFNEIELSNHAPIQTWLDVAIQKFCFSEEVYINVLFNDESHLQHGKRYKICIHAPAKIVEHEKWTETLLEVNKCSDGITVDLTSPVPGNVWIGLTADIKYQSSTSDIFINWETFTDVEEYKTTSHTSGILEYSIAIGSVKGGSDIVPFTTIGLVNHIALHNLNLQNGHDYFASVKGMDFLAEVLFLIHSLWKDVFYDVESGIQYYMLEVGSKPKFNDIVQPTVTKEDCEVSVNFVDTYVHEGHAYFFTIKAINKANLVTTASSWAYIYDKSPPEAGQVFDGISSRYIDNNQDIDFQTATTGIGAHWEEFYDPHTSVKVYKVAIEHALVVMTYYKLTMYYTTVTACNTADLCTSSTSDGVVIDNSPPNSGKVKDGADYKDINYQSLKYYIAATWQGFNDPQSGLDKYSVRIGTVAGRNDILSDRDGPLTDIIVFPNITTEIPTKTRIYITVRAYNKAGLYSEATSNGFIVDDTPPVFIRKPTLYNEVGSIIENSIVYRSCFKVTWEVNDEESFIERQYISVTSHRGGEINTTSTELNGIVRDYTYTRLDLHDGGEYFVNVIVCNGAKVCVKETSAGILVDNSPPITGTFAIHTDHAGNPDRHVPEWMMWSRFQLWLSWLGFSDLHTGIDYYMVSVGSEYMMDDLNGHGGPQKFHHQETNTSVEKRDEGKVGLSSDTIHSQFHLIPGGSLELIRRCSSQTCLGHCICAPKDKRCPLKGDSCIDNTHNADEPEGVIDDTIENIWHPCGQIDNALYTMPKGKLLNDMVSYSFFVRAWYDSNTFADFKSDGVTVMSKPLTTTNFIGVGVKEHLPDHWKNDIDVMLRGGMFSVSWHEAFINANSVISRFRVYLSTYPGGHDIHEVDIDLPGTMTAVNISRVPLLPGVWYYSNVVGYSYAGQHVTLSSDGFTVDIDKPTNGVINDGIGNSDIDFQNNSIIVSASWHGFGDSDSGISKYYWCVQFDKTDSDCDILPYQNVGIHRSVSRSINSSIINSGTKIVSKVYAVDFVGHVSDVITSNGVVIDDTPPRPVKMFLSEETKLMNPSFEESDTHFTDISTMSTVDICDHSRPNYWNFSDKSCVCVLGSSKSIAMHGRSFLFVRGNVWQLVDDLEADSSYSVKFCTAYVPFDDAVVSTKEGFVEFGNERHMFLIHRKHDNVDATTGILIDNIQVFKVVILEDKTLSGRVLSNAVWLHEWSSIHASWQFIDQESPIVEYAWAIGRLQEGSTEIQRYTSVGLNTFAYNYNIALAHTSQVHVTVVATNAVGLSSIATAESLLVDLTPPQIEFVYDGMGYDIDSQTTDEIIANWKVEDPESGLSHCEWAVGFSETGNDVQAFIPISPELTYVSKVFDHTLLSSRTVYVTLRCHNNAGLHSLRSTDGVTISNSPPSTKNAQLEILNLPVSEYPNKPHFQGNVTTMKFKWSGFEDFSGLDSYIVHVENKQKSVSLSRTVLYEHSGMVYCSLRGFELQDGSLLATVSAVNSAFLSSKPVTTNLTIFTKTPIIAVSVGTALNGADIIQWQETRYEYLIMHVPLRVKISKEMSIYITITAVGMNGLYSTKSVVLKL